MAEVPQPTTELLKRLCTDYRPTDSQYHRPTDSQYHRPTDSQYHRPTDSQYHRPTDSQYHRLTALFLVEIKTLRLNFPLKIINHFRVTLILVFPFIYCMDNFSIFTFYSNYCLNTHVLENIKIVELWVHEKYKSHYISSCAYYILLTFAVFFLFQDH